MGIFYLGGGLQIFFFTPKIGEDVQFDFHIFQMGWFNHQSSYGESSYKRLDASMKINQPQPQRRLVSPCHADLPDWHQQLATSRGVCSRKWRLAEPNTTFFQTLRRMVLGALP